MNKRRKLIGGVIVFIGLTPFLISLVASLIGTHIATCDTGAGEFTRCVLFGAEVTELFNFLIFLHWYSLVTLPVSIFIFFILLVLPDKHENAPRKTGGG